MREITVAACLLMFLPAPAPGQPTTTLAEAVESALERNPEVRRAREQLEEFNLRVRAVRADALPNLELVVRPMTCPLCASSAANSEVVPWRR